MKAKKLTAVVLACSMLAGMVAGCSTSSGSGETSQPETQKAQTQSPDKETEAVSTSGGHEPVTLRFSWWGGDARHEATLAALDSFMEKYPWITVEAEYGAFSGWAEKVSTELAAGTAPDVMQLNWNWIYEFSVDGSKFVDLHNYKDVIDLTKYDESVLSECDVAGKLQALPVTVSGKVFYWDKTTFDEAGIGIPETFDDLMAAGQIFKDKLGDEYYPMALYEYERMMFMVYYLESKYEKPWVVDNQLNYTMEELKDGLDWMRSLEENHVMPTIQELKSSGYDTVDQHSSWADGKFGGYFDWDSSQSRYTNALKEGRETVAGAYLKGFGKKDAGIYKITSTFGITETSKHKDEAALLINYLVSDPEAVKILNTTRGIPVNKEAVNILEEAGLLEGLTYEGYKIGMASAYYPLDPYFENAKLKDSTGAYYEVMEGVSYGDDTEELAQYLLDSINKAYGEKSAN